MGRCMVSVVGGGGGGRGEGRGVGERAWCSRLQGWRDRLRFEVVGSDISHDISVTA